MPAFGRKWTSACSAVLLRYGSTTTNLAPVFLRAARISSHVWIDVEIGSMPHTTIVSASGRFSGSDHGQPVMPLSANHCGPQIERSNCVAPSRLNSACVVPNASSKPIDPRYEYPRIDSRPCSSMLLRQRSAISVSASSQPIGSKSPLPLGPERRIGVSTRAGLYTRSRYRSTLTHRCRPVIG